MRSWMRRVVLGTVIVATGIGLGTAGVINAPVATVTPTPTPTATATPTDCAWSSGLEACFPKPQGSLLPGVTGIPLGTVMATYPNGGCAGSRINGGDNIDISTPNAVITNCIFPGSIQVSANNVTIRNSRVPGSIRTNGSATNFRFTVEYSDIGANSGCTSYEALIGVRNYEARFNYLHNNGDAFRGSGNDILAYRNFAVLCSNPGDHSDGFQGFGSGTNNQIIENTIDQRPATSITAPVFFADFSVGATILRNLLLTSSLSNAAIKLHQDDTRCGGTCERWRVEGNRVIGNAAVGGFGLIGTPCTPPTTVWSDNRQVTVNSGYQLLTTGSLVNC